MRADDDLRELPLDETYGTEGWIRETDEPGVRGIVTLIHAPRVWSLAVWAMDSVQDETLRSEMRTRISALLRSRPDVTGVIDDDPVVWIFGGTPDGRALTLAVATVVDEFARRIRSQL
jgi:hypothetical protein